MTLKKFHISLMGSRWIIILFWVMFLLPAVLLAAGAFKLLLMEQDRIVQRSADALADRAAAACESFHFTIEAIEANMTRSLTGIDPDRLEQTLALWEAQNPLVRNVFVYHPGKGLEYPVSGMAATSEERQFAARYAPLFSGKIPFEFNSRTGETRLTGPGLAQKGENGMAQLERSDQTQTSSKRSLVALSKAVENQKIMETGVSRSQSENPLSGWVPWFSENRLYILGWVRLAGQEPASGPANETVYGVELEWMTILSRLITDFPKVDQDGAALVLMDSFGNTIHQTGPLELPPSLNPVREIPVSRLIPHWHMAVFLDPGKAGTQRQFMALSLTLVGILLTAIISAGILVTRMTLEKIKDARQKTSFVSSVSHELKTPLTSIRMYAELLLYKRTTSEDKQHKYLSVIVDESSRLTRLINNVLDFSRLEQGRKNYQRKPLDLSVWLRQFISVHAVRIEKCGLKILTRISDGRYGVNTDQDALEQVVLNLVDNALKYAGKGRFIKFCLKKDQNHIQLMVQDDGPGIETAHRERIFEKFYRADNSLTAAQPGSGLGLSIARQIMADLGGDLSLLPESGHGASFVIRIKADETDSYSGG